MGLKDIGKRVNSCLDQSLLSKYPPTEDDD